MSNAPEDTTVLNGEVVGEPGEASLVGREPVINRLTPSLRELLFRKHDMHQTGETWRGPNGLSVADIASMLETAHMYGLDPFAQGEIWCARGRSRDSSPGRLLLMTGRNGLRKIAQRNRLEMRRDTVYAEDEFSVEWLPDHTCQVTHRWSLTKRDLSEKPIGAWSEVWERDTGRQRGFFFAKLDEYLPRNADDRSPWKNQLTSMILGASERQSIGQATPLGGLIFEGEADRNFETVPESRQLAAGSGDGSAPGWPEDLRPSTVQRLEDLVAHAKALGDTGRLGDHAWVQQRIDGMDENTLDIWIAAQEDELEREAEPAAVTTTDEEDGGG